MPAILKSHRICLCSQKLGALTTSAHGLRMGCGAWILLFILALIRTIALWGELATHFSHHDPESSQALLWLLVTLGKKLPGVPMDIDHLIISVLLTSQLDLCNTLYMGQPLKVANDGKCWWGGLTNGAQISSLAWTGFTSTSGFRSWGWLIKSLFGLGFPLTYESTIKFINILLLHQIMSPGWCSTFWWYPIFATFGCLYIQI